MYGDDVKVMKCQGVSDMACRIVVAGANVVEMWSGCTGVVEVDNEAGLMWLGKSGKDQSSVGVGQWYGKVGFSQDAVVGVW